MTAIEAANEAANEAAIEAAGGARGGRCLGALRAAVSAAPFFWRNVRGARKLAPFPAARFGPFVIEPLSAAALPAVPVLHAALYNGAQLGLRKMLILRLFGSRLCLLARREGSDEIVGMVMFYFNARDCRDHTVHEGYIGVREAERGQGLATFMRRHAQNHLARCGLCGVSSRISASNAASLRSNEKLGFVPVETYFDASMGEKRHYLICDLRGAHGLPQTSGRIVR